MSDLLERAKQLILKQANRTGVMVSLDLPREAAEQLAVPGGDSRVYENPDQLHVTLVYLGDVPSLGGYRELLANVVRRFAGSHAPVSGVINGNGRFSPPPAEEAATWAYFDAPLLSSFREALVQSITQAGIPFRPTYGFIPHITLAYTPSGEDAPVINSPRLPIRFDSIALHWGSDVESIPLNGSAPGYGVAVDARECASCAHFQNGRCTKFSFDPPGWATCDVWQAEGAEPLRDRMLERARALMASDLLDTTKPGDKTPGPSVKNPRVYEALLKQGYSQERAARISNSMVKERRDYLLEQAKHLRGQHDQAEHSQNRSTSSTADKMEENRKKIEELRKAGGAANAAKADLLERENERLRQQVSTSRQHVLRRAKELLNGRSKGAFDPALADARSFTVFKQGDGRYRWCSRSSNAFRDRDGEIVSTKALAEDVARADADGDYGPLRFWHMPGVDIGRCDFNWLRGRTLIESGTFADEAVGAKVAARAADYQISIGFKHHPDDPDKDGVYHRIKRFERSLVPAGRAANPFTSLTVKEQGMNDSEKLQALKTLMDDEALLQRVLAGADEAEKTAEQMGVAFKEFRGDLNKLSADELLQVAVARKEAALQPQAEKADDKEEDEDEDDMPKRMDNLVTKMGGIADRMEKMFASREKEAGTVTAVQDASIAQSERIAGLETKIKSLTTQLSEALASLKELQGDAPEGVLTGKRPSQAAETVTGTAEKANGQPSSYDQFMDGFVLGGQQ